MTLVGHSTGGGEVARYIARHGTKRVAKAVLIGAVTPLMLETPTNPNGIPMAVFDATRNGVRADRSQFFKDLCVPFYGANRPGANVPSGFQDGFWFQGMQASLRSLVKCVTAFSETDQTDDLRKFDIPTLIIHGDDDQIVPIDQSARRTVELIRDARLKVYPGASHGLCSTHKNQISKDLLDFLQS